MASLNELKAEHSTIKNEISKLQLQIRGLQNKQEKLKKRENLLKNEIIKQEQLKVDNLNGNVNWEANDFKWSKEVTKTLQEVFKLSNFRPNQLKTINATLSSKDVILIMSTGGGKSLCYQLPAVISKGITLVVSPLISLMDDQVMAAKKFKIKACTLNSDSTKEQVKGIHQTMIAPDPDFKILFVTPEKISKSKRFMAQLEKCYKSGNLSRIVIDEVHCASQWGNDFRPDYKVLGILKRQFPNSPILGLTATSTDKVTHDIMEILNIPFSIVFKTPLNRENLFYQVKVKPNKTDDVIMDIYDVINNNFKKQSGIIYCFSRKNCEEVSDKLNKLGLKCSPYHALMPAQVKNEIHLKWTQNNIQVIVATVAFGMGIDKPDVRFVIHHSISKSVENYYQESGRAGRDGKSSLCLLYFGFTDIFRQSCYILTEKTGLENLNQMVKYCQDLNTCRRNLISRYFGEKWDLINCNKMCDVCSNLHKSEIKDMTVQCHALLNIVHSCESLGEGHRVTGLKLMESAGGKGKQKTLNSDLKSLKPTQVQRLIVHMLINEFLAEDFHFTPYTTISYIVPGPLHLALEHTNVKVTFPSLGNPEELSGNSDFYCKILTRKFDQKNNQKVLDKNSVKVENKLDLSKEVLKVKKEENKIPKKRKIEAEKNLKLATNSKRKSFIVFTDSE